MSAKPKRPQTPGLPSNPLAPIRDPALGQPVSSTLDAGFLYGAATAAYQIEGAVTEDGRLPSIWDRFSAIPGKVRNGDSGAVACDHYHLWAEDVALIAELGFDAYRLSLAWPRLLTEEGRANPRGFDFYKRLLDALAEHGIRRFVTLYHWDLPLWIEERGGWISRETAYRFADYADLAVRELGDRVEAWATLNEPFCSAWLGYGSGEHAPGLQDPRLAPVAGHHLLLGHGLAMQALGAGGAAGRSGIVINLEAVQPASQSPEDLEAARRFDLRANKWFLDPLLTGEYTPGIFDLFGARPAILPEDMALIGQELSYLGINYYTRSTVKASATEPGGFQPITLPGLPRTDMGWEIYPDGLRQLLVGLSNRYASRLPPIFITENGMADADQLEEERVQDPRREAYFRDHLAAVEAAIQQGVDLRGYFAWSLLDNFEWAWGYEKRFGLCYVDYDSQRRLPKQSALWLKQRIKTRNQQGG